MSPEFKTIELAGLYESQGYFQDALDIYTSIQNNTDKTDPAIIDACRRLESLLEDKGNIVEKSLKKRVQGLLEQWLMLLIIKKRLDLLKKFQPQSKLKS